MPPCRTVIEMGPTVLRARLPADVACIEDVCRKAKEHLVNLGASEESFPLVLGIREALLNAVLHGSGSDSSKTVCILLDIQPQQAVIEVEDQGPGFDWQRISLEPPAMDAVSGRGLPIICSYFDTIEFNDSGNRIRLSKRLRRNARMSELTMQGELLRLTPRHDIVAATVQALRQDLKALVDEGHSHVELDFTHVEMVDSIGIGLLIATHNTLKAKGGGLRIAHANQDIRSLFCTMRLDKHFEVLPD